VAGGGYRPVDGYVIEPDATAASYFLAAAAMSGGRVRVPGLSRSSLQGDVAFADVLEAMGARTRWDTDSIEVHGDRLVGTDVDLRALSDTAPTLAVVAALAEGPTTVSGIGFVRGKESDRIAGPVAELGRCGVPAVVTADGFEVRPSGPPHGALVRTYDDHRMAMAFGVLGLVVPGIEIDDPGVVAKTFPGFFAALDQLR
jgi:3-phosphoshikimate 1-carboxyvinyltransferase